MSAQPDADAKRVPNPDEVVVPRFSRSGTQVGKAYLDGLVDSEDFNSKGQLSFKENRPTDTPYGRQTMEPRFPLADLIAAPPAKPPSAPRPSATDVTQRALAPEIASLEGEHRVKDAVIARLVRDNAAAREENKALRAKVAYLEKLARLLTNVIDSFCELFHVQNPTKVA
jgi:hypothetical protein